MNLLFDLDDTLHDKKASLYGYALSLWESNSLQIESERNDFIDVFVNENLIIQPKIEVFDKLRVQFHIPSKLASQMLNDFDGTFHEFSVAFPDSLSVLHFLKNKGVKIACVTNGRDFFQRNKISALGFEPYFDAIVTSGGLGVKKPNPHIFLESLRLLGFVHDTTCFCGDSLRAETIPIPLTN
tara:strand:- start:1341 stop:1889 length:549 start_codon:yes stop_codon:yes gene_type:complete